MRAARDLRDRLLRAAEQEIALNGLGKVSLRAIARRCGVSHQATAHHFDDRAGLFTVLAAEGFERLHTEMEAASADAPQEGGEPLAAAGTTYVRFAEENPTVFDVMFQPELVHTDDERLAAAKLALWVQLTIRVEQAQARGWGTHLPADMLAMTCWSTAHGLAAIRRDGQRSELSVLPEIDSATLVSTMTRALNESRG